MSDSQWTVREILQWTSKRLASEDADTPLLDAQLMLGKVLGLEKVQLYLHLDRPLSLEERSEMRALVQRRLKGEPVAYLLGYKHWHDITLQVDSRVLVPRPETETLLDTVLAAWRIAGVEPSRILDLCTGSGCLAIALARAFPNAEVIAIDISADALEVAKENAARNEVSRIDFRRGDVLAAGLFSELRELGTFDIVVSNPPYVSEKEWRACSVSVRDFEPRLALVADEDGLALGRVIVSQIERQGLLTPGTSQFLMELGSDAPLKLVQKMSLPAAEPFAYSSQHPLWDLPRGVFFALRDLASQARFLGKVEGLGEVSSSDISCEKVFVDMGSEEELLEGDSAAEDTHPLAD